MGAIMLHCNGCQDIRWMGGLMHYIPGLYVFYVTGSVSLAGLPYWSGYYCKSAAWFAAATYNSYIAALQLILLLTTVCTYVYLGRAGYLIFFGPKNGHRSIYRVKHQSPLATAAFWVLSVAAAYSGALWTHMCSTTLEATQITLLSMYEVCSQLNNAIPPIAWWQLTVAYTTIGLLAYMLAVFLIARKYDLPRNLFYLFEIGFVLTAVYVCI